MNLTRKYALVGGIWGLVLGYGAVAVVTGLGVAFLFAVVYGERPWADNTTALLYGLALLALLGSISICTALGYLYGRRAESLAVAERLGEHRRAHLLVGAAMLTALLGGYQLHAQNTALTNRQAWLDELLSQRHLISTLQVRERADHYGLEVSVDARGQREGRYMLTLQVLDSRGYALYERREAIEAPSHEVHQVVPIDYPDVIQRVLERDYRGHTSVTHRDALTLRVRLTPVLDRRELRALPGHAAAHYQALDSPFHSEHSRPHTLEFRAEGDQYWILTRGDWHPL